MPGEGSEIDVKLHEELECYQALQRLNLYLPNVHSIRKVCSKADTPVTLAEVLQTDANMYTVFADLVQGYQLRKTAPVASE